MKNYVISIFLCLTFLSTGSAQYKPYIFPNESVIDSLLSAGEISQVKEKVRKTDELKDKLKLTGADELEYSELMKLYASMFDKIEFREKLTQDKKKQYIKQFKLQARHFDSSFAGIPASLNFNKFINYSDQGRLEDALLYYTVSYYFKDRHLTRYNWNVEYNYKLAQREYKAKHFTRAMELYKYVRTQTKDNILYKRLDDSVAYFINASREGSFEQGLVNEYWKNEDKVDYLVKVDGGTRVMYNPGMKDINWELKSFYDYGIPIKEIPSGFGQGYFYGVNVSVWKGISIGAVYNTGKFTYIPRTDSYLLYMPDCTLKFSSYEITGKYYFRENIGMRPYLSAGLGEVHYTRSAIEHVTNRVAEFSMSELSGTSTQYLVQLGIEYVFSKNSNFVFDFELSLFGTPKNRESISKNIITAGLSLGVVI